MTREPDRFEEKAAEVLKDVMDAERRGDNMDPIIAAALRREHDAALDEAARMLAEAAEAISRVAGKLPEGCDPALYAALQLELMATQLRALASPAAAPAAKEDR